MNSSESRAQEGANPPRCELCDGGWDPFEPEAEQHQGDWQYRRKAWKYTYWIMCVNQEPR